MIPQLEKDLNRLVIQAFTHKKIDRINAVKEFCLTHFSNSLDSFRQKILTSQLPCCEKEILLINSNIEIMVSGWLPGNTSYPHDNDRAECFLFVLNGTADITQMRSENDELETTGKIILQSGDFTHLPEDLVHYMNNSGSDNLICLHVYTPCMSEMKVYDEGTKTVYIINGEAAPWLPADPAQINGVRSFEENTVDWSIY